MHGKQLHSKQLSSYKLQVWPFFLLLSISVRQVGPSKTTKRFLQCIRKCQIGLLKQVIDYIRARWSCYKEADCVIAIIDISYQRILWVIITCS